MILSKCVNFHYGYFLVYIQEIFGILSVKWYKKFPENSYSNCTKLAFYSSREGNCDKGFRLKMIFGLHIQVFPKIFAAPTGGSSSGSSSGASSRPLAGNINTFSSRFGSSSKPNKDDDSSDSDEEGQAFFAGGSETSGQQILGPSKKKDGADFVKHMFKKAKEHGAEAVDPGSAGAQASGSRSNFTGAGYKLGSNGKFFKVASIISLKS